MFAIFPPMKTALITAMLTPFCFGQGDISRLGKVSDFLFGKNAGDKLFYLPTDIQTKNPDQYGYRYDNVNFAAQDGTKLHGWFIHPTTAPTKGTVIFSHGNTGSIGTHFGFCSWFAQAGYQVFTYDYRGFGLSQGKLDRAGLVSDAIAAFDYVQTRKDILPDKIISFAHSLGGAKSIAALAKKKPLGLKAIIANATFASYRDLAEHHLGTIGKEIVSDRLSPIQHIAELEGTPILIIHGTADTTIPLNHGKNLFEAAKQPKTFWAVTGGTHNTNLYQNGQEYRQKILQWLNTILAKE